MSSCLKPPKGRKGGNAQTMRKEIEKHATSIFANYHILKDIIERHELLIQKRWKSKSHKQKLKILQSAWGERQMPKIHRPDWDAFSQRQVNQPPACGYARDCFLWPFLNEHNLLKPATLPLLLNSRGRHPPGDFAFADYEAMHVGLMCAAIEYPVLPYHAMLFTGRHDASRYGELQSMPIERLHDDFDDYDSFIKAGARAEARSQVWLEDKRHTPTGQGMLILESQDKTLDFLAKCAKEILHDMDETALIEAPVQPGPLISLREDASWAQLASEAPYRVPSSLNFARLESLLKAKCDEIEDHLWSLREDPSYFTANMVDAWNHRGEHVKDDRGNHHPLFRNKQENLLWARVILLEVVERTLMDLELWSRFRLLATSLKKMQERYAGIISPEEDLPEEYLCAILRFRAFAEMWKAGPIERLHRYITNSPLLRHQTVRYPSSDPTSTQVGAMLDHNGLHKVYQPFLYRLNILATRNENTKLFHWRMANVLDEMQRKIDDTPEVRKLITPVVDSHISDLAIMAECLRQVDSYQPWASSFMQDTPKYRNIIQEDHDIHQASINKIFAGINNKDKSFARFWTPENDKFYYPSDRSKTRQNVEAMRKAEQELDALCDKIDNQLGYKTGALDGTFSKEVLLQARSLQRTPPWCDPMSSLSRKKDEAEKETRLLSEIHFDLQLRTGGFRGTTEEMPQRKTKAKTRGQPAPASLKASEQESDEEPEPDQPVFAVDARALKVFRVLFYTPAPGSTPGGITWDDFKYAMTSMGFSSESLHGSARQFTPTELDTKAPIQIHEPHGPKGAKIPFLEARRFGRRLNKRYGWKGSMFVAR